MPPATACVLCHARNCRKYLSVYCHAHNYLHAIFVLNAYINASEPEV